MICFFTAKIDTAYHIIDMFYDVVQQKSGDLGYSTMNFLENVDQKR